MNFSHGLFSGVVVVRRRFGDWAYLLVRSSQGWQFITGARGDDEVMPDAARRHAWEAAKLSGLRFYWGHHAFIPPSDNDRQFPFLIAESASGDVGLADAWLEHRWLTASLAADMLPEATLPVLHWADALLTGADGTPGVKR